GADPVRAGRGADMTGPGNATLLERRSALWVVVPIPGRNDQKRFGAAAKLNPFTLLIDEILLADPDATRKQRHTVTPALPPTDPRRRVHRGRPAILLRPASLTSSRPGSPRYPRR
ncbi:hypothetical protein, partial [Streptomyces sp. NPDC055058]